MGCRCIQTDQQFGNDNMFLCSLESTSFSNSKYKPWALLTFYRDYLKEESDFIVSVDKLRFNIKTAALEYCDEKLESYLSNKKDNSHFSYFFHPEFDQSKKTSIWYRTWPFAMLLIKYLGECPGLDIQRVYTKSYRQPIDLNFKNYKSYSLLIIKIVLFLN